MIRVAIFGAFLAMMLSHMAIAQPSDRAAQMADAYMRLMGKQVSGADSDTVEADMKRLVAAIDTAPAFFSDVAAQAFVQAATLAVDGSEPATRGVAYDLARDILLTAADLSGQPATDFAPLALWDRADPFRAELVLGMGLAQSDLQAMDRLKALESQAGLNVIPQGAGADLVMAFWEREADRPINRILPTRFAAWVDGVEAAWPDLNTTEREHAIGILFRDDFPDAATLKKILGTGDVLMWVAAVDLPMTEAERAASKDLLGFAKLPGFAGPLTQPLTEIAAMQAAQGVVGGNAVGAMTNQLMRLNNWGAMTGEMSSWESYRYMTQ